MRAFLKIILVMISLIAVFSAGTAMTLAHHNDSCPMEGGVSLPSGCLPQTEHSLSSSGEICYEIITKDALKTPVTAADQMYMEEYFPFSNIIVDETLKVAINKNLQKSKIIEAEAFRKQMRFWMELHERKGDPDTFSARHCSRISFY